MELPSWRPRSLQKPGGLTRPSSFGPALASRVVASAEDRPPVCVRSLCYTWNTSSACHGGAAVVPSVGMAL